MNLVPGKPIRMTIFSQPAHLPVVRAALEKMCELVGFGEKCTGKIVLSVDEALTNIIRHAYESQPDKPIEVEMSPLENAGQGLRICLRDYGRQVSLETIRGRDLADVRPGGLGVHIMSQCMDRVEYAHVEGGTLLTMVKKLSSQE